MSMWRNNMHLNRHLACLLLNAGFTPREVADGWPKVWRLTRDGKLASRLQESTRITMVGVHEAIATKGGDR